jgi:hypothetical protein
MVRLAERLARVAVGAWLWASACGSSAHIYIDAPLDAPLDAPPDAAPCPADRLYQGQYLDWESTTSGSCGIAGAAFTVAGDSSLTWSTPASGQVRLCLPSATVRTQIDITPPSAASACASSPGSYVTTIPGLTMADPAVIATGDNVSYRDFSTTIGPTLNLDLTDGYLFVDIIGSAGAITLSEQPVSGAQVQYYDGTQWSTTMPATIVSVFYPNLDPTPGSVTVTMTGATGNGSVPLQASTISYITLVAGTGGG